MSDALGMLVLIPVWALQSEIFYCRTVRRNLISSPDELQLLKALLTSTRVCKNTDLELAQPL